MRDNNRFGREKSYGKSGGFRGGRDSSEPVEMHKAICDNCGNSCEVPFRPSGEKPVYCNNCFEEKRNDRSGDRGESSYPKRTNDRSYGKPSFNDREMFSAKCDECGKNCQVPFRPSGSKPVYCSDCFENKENSSKSGRNNSHSSEELDAINDKLDKILRLLESPRI